MLGQYQATNQTDENGNPIRRKLRDYMDETSEDVARAEEDGKLFEVAAGCMMGID